MTGIKKIVIITKIIKERKKKKGKAGFSGIY